MNMKVKAITPFKLVAAKLSKDEIFRTLKKHHASESDETLREVSYNLAIASVEEDNLLDKAATALERVRSRATASPLTQHRKAEGRSELQVCPICRIAMSSVKLLEDKPAWYCADHRIVVPKPVEE